MHDPAHAGPRTRLAWERMSLSLAANGVLLATAALHHAAGLVVVPFAVGLIAAAAAMGRAERPGPDSGRGVRRAAALTVATAIVAALVVVLPFP